MGFLGYGYCNNYLFGRYFPLGGILMFLLFAIVIGLFIFFIYKYSKKDIIKIDSPIDILKKKYVNNEISKEEYEQKKKDIL